MTLHDIALSCMIDGCFITMLSALKDVHWTRVIQYCMVRVKKNEFTERKEVMMHFIYFIKYVVIVSHQNISIYSKNKSQISFP